MGETILFLRHFHVILLYLLVIKIFSDLLNKLIVVAEVNHIIIFNFYGYQLEHYSVQHENVHFELGVN